MREKVEENFSSTLVIIASLNEEAGIGPTLAEIRDYLGMPLCLVVDSQSLDGTARIAKQMGAQVILHKGLGKGNAIATAIKHAKGLNVKYVVFVDADFTYPAEFLPEMIKILEDKPDVGMVCGNRFNSHFHLSAMQNLFYLGNRILAFTHNLLNGVNIRDPLTGLRVVRWCILQNWMPKSKGFDIEVELNHHVERQGYGIVEIPILYRDRLGEKKLKLRHGLSIMKRILSESLH